MGLLSSLPPERGSASRLAQAQLKARIHTSLTAALTELRTAIPGRDVRLFQGVREREDLSSL